MILRIVLDSLGLSVPGGQEVWVALQGSGYRGRRLLEGGVGEVTSLIVWLVCGFGNSGFLVSR